MSAIGFGVGRNDTDHGTRHALFLEGAIRRGLNSVYSRLEAVQLESALLHDGHTEGQPRDTVVAWTLGAVRDVMPLRGFEIGVGGDLQLYGVPAALQSTYDVNPVSFRVFLRLRPPAPAGRMWNTYMTKPMTPHPAPVTP
jgi:hypothetical protein